ncbi:MAG: flagellar filament outer layer protein FlaA [Spirochaetes bacterium]|nr:flagellar filament outer layer protein FlaA [Spirochaetota bacterium]MBU1078899.1 flagellar filament outer layer protein FlaA [Spirochaetota bacterium]
MKQRVVKAICLSFVIVFMLSATGAFADDETVNLESIVVQSFDEPEAQPWFLIGSKFATKGFPKLAYAKSWPVALFGTSGGGKDLRSLGISMLFDRKEYNWVDVIPGKKTGSGEEASYEPIELPLPGRVRMLDMWIWSGNYDYYIEAYIRDYKGIVHTLPMGDLGHAGWKNFRVNIPDNVPQSKKYLPKRENLTLVKFRIWTRPTEIVAAPAKADASMQEKSIYFYFDQLKVLTDTFETLFDGDSLMDPKVIEDIWGSSDSSK